MDLVGRNYKVAIVAALVAGTVFLAFRVRNAQKWKWYANMINAPAPGWMVRDWMHSEPLTLEELRGKIVLVRWWTGPGCPYCTPSALILSEIYKDYRGKGVVVVGFYHHKADDPVDKRQVRQTAENMGMEFPLAIDYGWVTLKRYWLDKAPTDSWTSVSFLIDQHGIARYVHPGGTIAEEDADEIRSEIEALLQIAAMNAQ